MQALPECVFPGRGGIAMNDEIEVEEPEVVYVESPIGWELRCGEDRLAFLPKEDGWTQKQIQTICDIDWFG